MKKYQELNDYAVDLADPLASEEAKSEAGKALASAGYSDQQLNLIHNGYYAGSPEDSGNTLSET